MGTCCNSSSANVIETSELGTFRSVALTKHNEFRHKHGAPDLKINKTLNNMAQEYAEKLFNCKGNNSFPLNIYNNSSLGENIIICKTLTAVEICQKWYDEKNTYDFNLNKFQKESGHFTQLIWKDSKEVGFGYKLDNDICCAVVYYYPAGNVLGEFSKNVQKEG